MPTFNVTLRLRKEKGKVIFPENNFLNVYISVAHQGKTMYIKTNFTVTEKSLRKTYNRIGNEDYEIKDIFILKECYNLISDFHEKCNKLPISKMTIHEVVECLNNDTDSISFNEFADRFINEMINDNRDHPARNYRSAVNSFYKFVGRDRISFDEISSSILKSWIKSLMHTSRARNAYPNAVKTIYNAGKDYYNDYDKDVILIPNEPFRHVNIPKDARPGKRNIPVEDLKAFFNYTPKASTTLFNKEVESRESLAYDVAKLVFCLAGINTVDLYKLEKKGLQKGKLKYYRAKTKDRRDDGAYMEIKIPSEIKDLIIKYKGDKKLFSFADRYANHNEFNRAVNVGLKQVCKKIGIKTVSTYSFRHSWATIAQNHCKASLADVAFALNHVSQFRVTERYVEIDYSPVDDLNRKVIDFIKK